MTLMISLPDDYSVGGRMSPGTPQISGETRQKPGTVGGVRKMDLVPENEGYRRGPTVGYKVNIPFGLNQ